MRVTFCLALKTQSRQCKKDFQTIFKEGEKLSFNKHLWCTFCYATLFSRSSEYVQVLSGVCLIPWHFLWLHISDMFDWSYVIAGFVTSVWFMMPGPGVSTTLSHLKALASVEQKLLPIHFGLHLILYLITFRSAQPSWIVIDLARVNIFDDLFSEMTFISSYYIHAVTGRHHYDMDH